jgi:uncharacterized phosphosugar-binding protein
VLSFLGLRTVVLGGGMAPALGRMRPALDDELSRGGASSQSPTCGWPRSGRTPARPARPCWQRSPTTRQDTPMTTSWLTEARRALDVLESTQGDALQRAAALAADSIAGGHVMYAFGTGHSRMPVEEIFPRYGSFPGFHPIVELSMTFHTQVVGANGQRQAMFIERVEGLAQSVLDNFRLRRGDSMIVFSVSGLNAVPVEMAMGARKAGIPVVAVTSLAETMSGSPRHSTGTRLVDHADVVIDLCSPSATPSAPWTGCRSPWDR